MNNIYRVLWSEALGTYVAVSELAKADGAGTSASTAGGAVLALMSGAARSALKPMVAALVSAGLAHAGGPAANQLPQGAQVAAGVVSIRQSVGVMDVLQSSDRAVVNWQSFDLGASAKINFNQPQASSAILNRVLGSTPSQIFGQINSNGQVFLTNPSGVYFAPGSSVDVGALTATTHSMGDTDFMAGKFQLDRNGATGSVVNEGILRAQYGGYIALLAPEVRQQGLVVAKMGTVAMAAGERYQLQMGSDGNLSNVLVTPATIAALVETGNAVQAPGGLVILSAQAASSLQAGVVNNTGVLSAAGLVRDGGVVRLVASDRIQNTGTISADAALSSGGQGGRIEVVANLSRPGSSAQVDGKLSAKGGSLGGDGGFIETSASNLQIADSAQVSTTAAAGKSGTWLLDPNDFTVAASGGNLTPTALVTALNTNNVSITTTSGNASTTGVSSNTGTAGNGDININSAISGWSANTLTLSAYRNINISAAISGTGTSALSATAASGSGSAVLGANVTTGGAQTYNGSLLLNAATTLQSTTAGIAINGDIAPGTASALTINNATASAVSGVISGNIALTKGGAGTLTLTSANTYTGGTTITAGTLALGANDVLADTGNLTLSGSGTLSLGSYSDTVATVSLRTTGGITGTGNATLTSTGAYDLQSGSVSAILAGNLGAAKSGAGTVTLSGANTYTGGTSIAAGTLALGASDVLADTGNITISGSGTLNLGSYSDTVATVSLQSSGGINGTGSATLTSSGAYDLQSGSVSAILAGTLGAVKSGSGTVTLTGANTYSGGTTVSAGVLKLGNAASLGVGAVTVGSGASSTATLDFNGVAVGNAITVYGYGADGLTGSLGLGALSNSSATSVTLTSAPTLMSDFTVGGSGNLVLAYDLTTNYGLTKLGTGTVTLSGLNSYTGATTVSGGVLKVGNSTALGSSAVTVGSTATSSATLDLNGQTIANSITLYGQGTSPSVGALTNSHATTAATFSGGVTLGGAAGTYAYIGGNKTVVSGLVSGAAGLYATAKSLVLTNDNTYTGGTKNGGVLQIGDGGTSGTILGAVEQVAGGQEMIFKRSDNNTFAGTLLWGVAIRQSGSGVLTLTGANTGIGQITIDAGATVQIGGSGYLGTGGVYNGYNIVLANGSTFEYSSSVAQTIGPVASISGTGRVVKDSQNSTLTLSQPNYYSGGTLVTAGTLKLGSGTALGSGAATVGTSGTSTVTLDLNGQTTSNALTLYGYGAGGAGGSVGVLSNSNESTAGTASGAITLASDVNWGGLGNFTASGVVSGTASVTKVGTGTTTLSNSNTYIGTTTVSAGVLRAGNANAFGTNALNSITVGSAFDSLASLDLNGQSVTNPLTIWGYGANATMGALTNSSGSVTRSALVTAASSSGWWVGGAGNLELGFILSGSNKLTVVGTGVVTLSNASNDYSGGSQVNAGTLKPTHPQALGGSGVTVGTNASSLASLDLNGLTISHAVTLNGYGTGGAGGSIGALTNSNSLASNLVGDITLATTSYVGGANEIVASGLVAGSAGLTKVGAGTLTLSGSNTYTGLTTISAGILKLGAAGDGTNTPLGTTGTGTTVASGAALDLNGYTLSTTEALTLNGTGVSSGGALMNSGAAASYSGLVSLGSASSIVGGAVGTTGTIAISNLGTITGAGYGLTLGGTAGGSVASVIGTGTGTLTKQGTGTWTLSANNTYTGTTTVSTGTLSVTGTLADTSALTVASGATYQAFTSDTVGSIAGAGNIVIDSGLTLTSGGDNTSTTFSGVISGAAALTKIGSGTLTLSGNSTYSGLTTISAGLIKLGAAGNSTNTPLGTTGTGTVVSATGAALDLGGFTLGTAEALTLNGTGVSSGGALMNSGAAATYAGLVSLGSASSIVGGSGTIAISNAGTITGDGYGLTLGGSAGGSVASVIGTGAGTLTKEGTGTWTLSGSNTYTGLTTISAGILKLGATGTEGSTPLGSTGTTVNSNGALDLNGYSLSTALPLTLNGTGVSSGGALMNSGAAASYSGLVSLGSASSIVGDSGTIAISNAGTITGAGYGLTLGGSAGGSVASVIGTGAGTLTKEGTGTWTLSGNSSYTGLTTISAGVLKLGAAGTGTNTPLGTTGTGTTVAIGAALDLNGYTLGAAEALTLNGTGVSSGGALMNSGAAASYSGLVSLGSASSILGSSGTIAISNAGTITGAGYGLTLGGSAGGSVASVIGTGAGTLTKEGTGTWTLSGNSTYTGLTTISAGVFKLGAAGTATNTPLGTTGTGTTVASGAALDLNGFTLGSTEAITLNGGTLSASTGTGSLSGSIALGADSLINVAGTQLTLSGVVSANSFGLAFLGSGITVLNNSSNGLSKIATSNSSSGGSVGALSVINGTALEIGQVTAGGITYRGISSTGAVAVQTRTGNLTVSQNVVTTSASSTPSSQALRLLAGSATAAGNAAGGDIVLIGSPGFFVGAGGIAALYSGGATSISGTRLVDNLSSKTSSYTQYSNSSSDNPSSGAGYYAMFRESATVVYLLPLTGQGSTYGTSPATLSYCYSSSSSSCSYVSYSGVPDSTQTMSLASNALTSSVNVSGGVSGSLVLSGVPSGFSATTDANTYNLQLQPSLTLTGYVFNKGNAVSYTVSPKPVNITNAAFTATYNGLSSYADFANSSSYTVGAMVGQDAVRSVTQTPSGAGLVAANIAVAGSFTVTPSAAVLSTGKASNYVFTYGAGTATVNKASLTVMANDDARFVGQTDTPGYAGVSYSGFVASENSSVLTGTLSVERANATVGLAGTYVDVLNASGLSSSNYSINYVRGTYTVVPADQLLIRLNNATSTYGTTATYALSSVKYLNKGNDVVDLTASASVSGAAFTLNDGAGGITTLTLLPKSPSYSTAGLLNAAAYPVGVSILNTSGNYGNTVTVTGSLVVNPKGISVAATSGLSKTYDGTTTIANPGLTIAGSLGNDVVSASGVGTYSSADAGTNKAFTVSGITLSGADAANYRLSSGNTLSASSGTIIAAPLLITANNDSKSYDSIPYSGGAGVVFSGFVNDETSSVLSGTLSYGGTSLSAVNVGTYEILPSGLSSSNYAVSFGTGSLHISAADITVSPTNASLTGTVGKVYDGTDRATLTPSNYAISGWQGADGAIITKTVGTYDTANAGAGKLVSVALSAGDFSATGATNLSNYNLPSNISGYVGLVSPKPVTITNTPRTTTYDGVSTYASLAGDTRFTTPNGALAGSDTVASVTQVASLTGIALAGSYTATPSAAVMGAGSADNYSFSYVASTNTIDKAALTVTANAANKTYNAQAYSAGNGVSYSGFVPGENASVLTGTLSYAGDSQGAVNAGSYTITPGGLGSANYAISYANGTLTIDKAPLSLVISKPYDGDAIFTSSNTYTLSGMVNSESAPIIISGTASTGLADANTYNRFSSSTLTLSNPNYTLTGGATTATIKARAVIAANPVAPYEPSKMPPVKSANSSESAGSATAGGGLSNSGSSGGISVSTIKSPTEQETGLVSVTVPVLAANSSAGVMVDLPSELFDTAQALNQKPVGTLPGGQPLPSWIRFDAEKNSLLIVGAPPGGLPIDIVLTVGRKSAVVKIEPAPG